MRVYWAATEKAQLTTRRQFWKVLKLGTRGGNDLVNQQPRYGAEIHYTAEGAHGKTLCNERYDVTSPAWSSFLRGGSSVRVTCEICKRVRREILAAIKEEV